MPLIKSKSKQAVGENISREMSAGKPRDQAIAIALSTQRRAKRKKFAEGGMVETPEFETEMPQDEMHDEDFLSPEQDDSALVVNTQDHLSQDQEMIEPKGLLVNVMERLKHDKMRKKYR